MQQIVGRLRAHHYRLTPQRMAVLEALLRDARHPSAEEIYRELQPTYPMMSPATVYKTLATLKELGEVLELGFSDGHNRYDAYTPRSHPHLICRHCGRIEDYPLEEFDHLVARVAAQSGYRDLTARLDFLGVCRACSANTPSPATQTAGYS